jgi:hypothetical protein
MDEDHLSDVITGICEIMRFDPTVKKYTPERGKQIMAARKKRAEALGVSTYITGGGKATYEKSRQKVI